MKLFPLLLLLAFVSCIDESPSISQVSISIDQQLFGKAQIGYGLLSMDDLLTNDGRLSEVTTYQEPSPTLMTTIRPGTPFLLLVVNNDRWAKLRITIDRTGHPSSSILSFPELRDINVIIFDNGNKSKTTELEDLINDVTFGDSRFVVRRGNY
jgi:hypothetical protein